MVDRRAVAGGWFAGRKYWYYSGASAPEILVQQVISRLKQIGAEQIGEDVTIEELSGVVESVVFPLPKA